MFFTVSCLCLHILCSVMVCHLVYLCVFLFNDTATNEIYTDVHTLSLHDALPIFQPLVYRVVCRRDQTNAHDADGQGPGERSEEHTSELQSLMRRSYAVFSLKKKQSK